MDAYLDIATAVLRSARRPLSPRAILVAAYRAGIVPSHLYGKTQQKTLQARLSEDIVLKRDQSPFFRTAPGRFFLREFLADATIAESFRQPIPTRRRFRELVRGPALAMDFDVLKETARQNTRIGTEIVMSLLRADHCRYEDPRANNSKNVFIRSFVCVNRSAEILSYRLGRYREDRDAFMFRRSIGFSAFVHADAHTLFNFGSFGIIDAGVGATRTDLDIPQILREEGDERKGASLAYFVWVSDDKTRNTDLLAVIAFECPEWFEPSRRRLALNDLSWLDLEQGVNNIDDFDPWSKAVLLTFQYGNLAKGAHNGYSLSFP